MLFVGIMSKLNLIDCNMHQQLMFKGKVVHAANMICGQGKASKYNDGLLL